MIVEHDSTYATGCLIALTMSMKGRFRWQRRNEPLQCFVTVKSRTMLFCLFLTSLAVYRLKSILMDSISLSLSVMMLSLAAFLETYQLCSFGLKSPSPETLSIAMVTPRHCAWVQERNVFTALLFFLGNIRWGVGDREMDKKMDRKRSYLVCSI